MKIKFSPQVGNQFDIQYSINGETITSTINGEVDSFDLSVITESNVFNGYETNLPINPICKAFRNDEGLHVELFKQINPNASRAERFPEYFEFTDGVLNG